MEREQELSKHPESQEQLMVLHLLARWLSRFRCVS
jgi:hypothetical protein